ncbi:hypothetical protein niasHT_022312 [Heterodera trifolii]|uniref:Peptidase S1 domain-containing protein n=1 Tax=Heterodera trifolii TaxID=157864 RepID=A0ABD2KNY0_9BILA
MFFVSFASRAVKRSLYSAKFPLALNEIRSVVSLNSYFSKIVQFCSGVLLTENIVLTAAHCVLSDEFGLADYIHVKGFGWNAHSTEFVIRTDFIFLDLEDSICADIALIFLPPKVTGIFGTAKFTKFTESEWSNKSDSDSKIYALGYGITELHRMSFRARKVPLKKLEQKVPKCSLEFYFADSALSCSGDSGGPVIYYGKTGGKLSILSKKKPIFLGIVSQLLIYANPSPKSDCTEGKVCSTMEKKRKVPKAFGTKNRTAFADHQLVEGCRRAHKLLIVHTEHIQKWIEKLINNEQNSDKKAQFMEALKVMNGNE